MNDGGKLELFFFLPSFLFFPNSSGKSGAGRSRNGTPKIVKPRSSATVRSTTTTATATTVLSSRGNLNLTTGDVSSCSQ